MEADFPAGLNADASLQPNPITISRFRNGTWPICWNVELKSERACAGRKAWLRRDGFHCCQCFNVLRPQFEGLSHLPRVTMPLIDSSDTAESAAAVVQRQLDDVRSNAEPL